MEKNFERCLDFVLKYEGGFVNNPRDPGGATNRGITRATLAQYRGRPVSIADVKALTREEAAKIYYVNYWRPIGADKLRTGVDLVAFDIAVNMGVSRAINWLHATDNMPYIWRDDALASRRMKFWQSLKTWRYFGKGWTARGKACIALSNAMQIEEAKNNPL